MNEETNMTNDQNVNADERGQRRQTAAVRKATKEYEDAHDLAKTSDSTSEREHADDLRKVLIAEVQEARLSLPPPTNGAGPSPLASALANANGVLGRLGVLVPPAGNDSTCQPTIEAGNGSGSGDGPREPLVIARTNDALDDDGDVQMSDLGPSVSRQQSNHSGLSNASNDSHVERTRLKNARERETLETRQRLQDLEDKLTQRSNELTAERRRRERVNHHPHP